MDDLGLDLARAVSGYFGGGRYKCACVSSEGVFAPVHLHNEGRIMNRSFTKTKNTKKILAFIISSQGQPLEETLHFDIEKWHFGGTIINGEVLNPFSKTKMQRKNSPVCFSYRKILRKFLLVVFVAKDFNWYKCLLQLTRKVWTTFCSTSNRRKI